VGDGAVRVFEAEGSCVEGGNDALQGGRRVFRVGRGEGQSR